MLNIDLEYNPYLLETNIKFNGKLPKINSRVYQYQDSVLQTWIRDMPEIFFNEMNGYDFSVSFTGTQREFEDLKKAFGDAGVTDEQVHLFHKNELDGRDLKINGIKELLEWLKNTPNRNFDNTAFLEEYSDMIEPSYSLVMVNDPSAKVETVDGMAISIEYVNDIHELDNSDLRSIPVIFNVSEDLDAEHQSAILKLMERKDVLEDQLFFRIGSGVDHIRTLRILNDLGIEEPQIVERITDRSVRKYFEIYPVTEYISEMINAFEKERSRVADIVGEENIRSIISNGDAHKRIETLEQAIKKAKAALSMFEMRDMCDPESDINYLIGNLKRDMEDWKNRKTVVSNDDAAEKLALEYQILMENRITYYVRIMNDAIEKLADQITGKYLEWYENSEIADDFNTDDEICRMPAAPESPQLTGTFMEQKVYEEVEETGLFGFMKNSDAGESVNSVLEPRYYLNTWRNTAAAKAEDTAKKYLADVAEAFKAYEKKISEMYIEHIRAYIEKTVEMKDAAASQLSEDEKAVQADNDWLEDLSDMLMGIERN